MKAQSFCCCIIPAGAIVTVLAGIALTLIF